MNPNAVVNPITLRYLFCYDDHSSCKACDHLQTFRPVVKPFANSGDLVEINDPKYMDLDAICFNP